MAPSFEFAVGAKTQERIDSTQKEVPRYLEVALILRVIGEILLQAISITLVCSLRHWMLFTGCRSTTIGNFFWRSSSPVGLSLRKEAGAAKIDTVFRAR